jgi:hypothetical protein
MEILINFGLSVISSIVATLLLLITATWRSKTTRRVLTSIAATFLRVEIKYASANTKDAELEIKAALDKARHVRIFSSRGNEYQGAMYQSILKGAQRNKVVVQVLLPDPTQKSQVTDWIDQREREIAAFDKAYGKGTLRRQIESNLQFLQAYVEVGRFEVRKYNHPHIGRIILTDDVLFLQPYKDDLHGRDCPVIEYGHGDMYEMFSRFFDMIWANCASQALPNNTP